MRLSEMAQALVDDRLKRGLGMRTVFSNGSTSLMYTDNKSAPIATITERKGDSFRLTIHPYRYGAVYHGNRISAVLQVLKGEDSWARYTSFMRYGSNHIYDRKMCLEIRILDKPIEFIFANGELRLDYDKLERLALHKEDEPVKTEPTRSVLANNSAEAVNQLTALVANI